MSDGPFKNLKLGRRWKRFAEAAQNEAFNSSECCALASDALLHEIFSDSVRTLLAALQAYINREQLDLDLLSSVESIFNAYMKTPFSDTFQKQMVFLLNDQNSPADGLRQALKISVNEQANEARNRIIDECISKRETGEMWPDQFSRAVKNTNAIFDVLPKNEVCDALLSGNKNAFRDAVSKKKGLDDGAPL